KIRHLFRTYGARDLARYGVHRVTGDCGDLHLLADGAHLEHEIGGNAPVVSEIVTGLFHLAESGMLYSHVVHTDRQISNQIKAAIVGFRSPDQIGRLVRDTNGSTGDSRAAAIGNGA